jgi:hypothetical protein
MAEDRSTQALFDLWKKQIDEGTNAWASMMGQAHTPDLTQFWRPFMDQGITAWSKLFTQGPVTPDLMDQWKRFLDDWIAAWGKALEQAMGTQAFAQALGKQLDQWLSVQGPLKKAKDETTEATLAVLGVASRTQMVGIARQLEDLEDRIEGLEDTLAAVLARLEDLRQGLAERQKGQG